MFARCPTPRELFRSGLLAGSLTLSLLVIPAHAGMIGTGVSPRAVAIGDLNEDGYADLVSGNHNDSTVTISLGRGNGRFRPKVQYSCGSYVYAIALADVNGDNHLDVVNCCSAINKVGVRFGAGDGTLGARTDYSANQPQGVVARDLTGDGLTDLAVVGLAQLTTLIASGPGTFNPVSQGSANSSSLDVGDVDGDGDPDIVTGNLSGNGALVYFNLSPGIYSAPTNLAMQAAATSVVLADFNHDGALDIAATVPSFAAVNVRRGIGNGTFAPIASYPTAATPVAMVSADLNGDTHADLILPSPPGNIVSVLRGTGSGTFLARADFAAGVNPNAVAVGLLDGDANPDLAIALFGQNSIATLTGNGDGTFQVPSGAVYVWANASGSAFDPNAWLPARNTNSGTDILVFNRGGAVSVGGVTTASVGQFVVSGGTQASIFGFGSSTLTIAGGTGDDGVVEEESKMVLASIGNPLSVNIASGAHATVYGDVEIRGGNSHFQALDVAGILYQSTGRAIIGPGSSATPFGNGTGASGQASVRFQYGSQYIAQTPIAVFGASYPFSVVDFIPGSRFRMDAAFNPDVSGRRYADFEYNVPGGNSAFTGGSPLILDSLIVSQGTLSIQMTGGISFHGNIALNACAGTLRFNPSSPVTWQLGGISTQSIRLICGAFQDGLYISPNVTLDIDNPADVMIHSYLRSSGSVHFTAGRIIGHPIAGNPQALYAVQLDSTAVVTGASASTGWFATALFRRVPGNGVLRMDVGDLGHYLPMDIDFHGVTAPGIAGAGTPPYDAYYLSEAQLDMAHRVHRYWGFVAHNDAYYAYPVTFFSDADITFPFQDEDLSPGTDPSQLVLRAWSTDYRWSHPVTTGTRTATSIQVTGFFPIGYNGWNFAAGYPITPSLSVSGASGAEGNGALAGRVQASQAQSAGGVTFRVQLSQSAIDSVKVDYQTADGTATVADGDYTPVSGTLTFAPGDTALDIVVPFGADATPERNESFGITLSNASNATIVTPAATATILDDDDLVAPTAQVIHPNGGEVIHQNQQVNLQWSASDNVAVSGVDIQLVNGASVTTLASNYPNTGSYQWLSTGPASIKMKFRVVAHDDPGHVTTDNSDANWEVSPYTIGVDDDVPLTFALPAPSPNPSPTRASRITFAVPHEAQVRLTVHDVRGRKVATLENGTVPAGRHTRTWDSSSVGAGIYFLHLEAPGFRADQRLVVVR